MKLHTPRLIIRDYEKNDAPGLFQLLSTPVVHCFSDEAVSSLAEAEAEVDTRRKQGWRYAVCLADSGAYIGDLFADPDPPDTYSLGWNFLPEAGGKGYATEAASALMDHLFQTGARRLYAYTEDNNFPSQRLCERLGMREEGLFLEFISFVKGPDGEPIYENTFQYAILRREWEEKRR